MIYVGDIMVVASEQERDELLAFLWKKYPVKDLGGCKWYDGFRIETDLENGTTTLSQKAYTESIFKRCNVTTTVPIPAVPGADLGPEARG